MWPTRLLQWTRRLRVSLHLFVSGGAPLTSAVSPFYALNNPSHPPRAPGVLLCFMSEHAQPDSHLDAERRL